MIAYVSSYGYTKKIAEALAEGIKKEGGINVDITDIEKIELGELDAKLNHAQAIIVGSPTLNQNILLPIYKLFCHYKTPFAKGENYPCHSVLMDGVVKQ